MEGGSTCEDAASSAVMDKTGGQDGEKGEVGCSSSCGPSESCGICAICLGNIPLQKVALVKGCEHAYCMTCILTWVNYNKIPSCPLCKHPFEFLIVHRTLDGCVSDFMLEESVCLLLRATWFFPTVEPKEEEASEEIDDDEDGDFEEDDYVSRKTTTGDRRWEDCSYIRAAGPSSKKNKAVAKVGTGRRAKRALKREAADKAAAAENQLHLDKLGRK